MSMINQSTKNNAIWKFAIIVLLVFAIFVFFLVNRKEVDNQKVKIGFVGPFTDNAAVFGDMMQNGLDLAFSELPPEDQSKIEIIKEDDQCQGASAVSAVSKLINIDRVKYVIGPLCNEGSLATEKLFEDNKVISISIGLPSTQIANMGPFHYSFSPEIEYLMQTLAEYAINQGHKKIAIVHMNANFEEENYKHFVSSFNALGGEIVADESSIKGSRDFRIQLVKIKQNDPEAIMLVAHTQELTSILRQMNELGFGALPKYGIHAAETPDIITNIPDLAEGLIYPYPADKNNSPSAQAYYSQYKNAYHFDADPYSSNVYDSFHILVQAIKKCGYKNIVCVQGELNSLQDYAGANGLLSVDARGVGTYKEIMLKKIEHGTFTALSEK